MNEHDEQNPIPADASEAPAASPENTTEPISAAEDPAASAPESAAPAPHAEFQLPESDSQFTLPDEPTDVPPPAYRWVYAENATVVEPPPNRRATRLFVLIMTAVFLVSFAMLIAVLWVGRDGSISILRPGVDAEHEDVAIDGVEQARHSVVVIETTVSPTSGGTGTGIILTADGYIATNHHVIEGAEEIRVTFYDGRTATAELVGSSEMDDLAVIKVATIGLTPAVFAEDKDTYVGETVYAIGTPAGPEFAWTTTKGIISYKDREVKIYDDDDRTLLKKLRLLQTDANVNPGNSGGPLINTAGEVVGVVSMKLAEGYEGIGFAIPSDGAVEILEAIMNGTLDDVQSSISHKRPMLGIVCVEVTGGKHYVIMGNQIKEIAEQDLERYPGYETISPAVTGVYVMEIAEGMDAVGKIQEGDIITEIEGVEIKTGDELSAVVNQHYAGDTVTLTFYRGRLYSETEITLSTQPDE